MKTISRDAVMLSHSRPVRIHPFSNHGGYPAHGHEFHEICLITGGSALHRSTDGDKPLKKGSVIVTAPGQIHAFVRPRSLCGVNVYYLAPWLLSEPMVSAEQRLVLLFMGTLLFPEKHSDSANVFKLSSQTLDKCIALMDAISSEQDSGAASLFAVKLLFLQFLHMLSREAGEPSGGVFANARLEVLCVLKEVERCVRENAVFSVGETALKAHCSTGHLHRIFTGVCGTPPMAYYQRRRMQHAADLILNPDISLTEVAHRIGCADSAHFSRTFRRQIGMSPREYRAKYLH